MFANHELGTRSQIIRSLIFIPTTGNSCFFDEGTQYFIKAFSKILYLQVWILFRIIVKKIFTYLIIIFLVKPTIPPEYIKIIILCTIIPLAISCLLVYIVIRSRKRKYQSSPGMCF